MSNKTRLDVLLVEQGLQESRQKAQATIMSGLVFEMCIRDRAWVGHLAWCWE